MKKRIHIFLRSLSFKWVLITCIVVLPVNILAAVTAGMMKNSYRENLLSSYNSYLNIFSERVEVELASLQTLMQNFLDGATLVKLNFNYLDDSVVEVLRFKKYLANSNAWSGFSGICTIWDQEKDIISFINRGNQYTKKDFDSLEQKLRQGDVEIPKTGEWKWVTVEEKAFIMQYYDFPNFSFGILLDIADILQDYYSSSEITEGEIYWAGEDGRLFAFYDETGFQIVTGEKNLAELQADSQTVLEKGINGGTSQLIQVVDEALFMKDFLRLPRLIYILTMVSFIILPVMYALARGLVMKPLIKLVGAMQRLENGDLESRIAEKGGSMEMDFLYHSFNHMVDELNRLVISSYEQEIEKLRSDAINMRLQVNQHMVLNFLNTIYSLSQVGKNEQIGEFSILLMNYFRYVLRQNVDLVPVKEELDFVRNYLEIQKMRFPNSFTCVYSMEPEAENIPIPQLLIENCVENAVKYGLIMGSEIEIIINIRVEEERLLISVCDTGNGMESEVLEKLNTGKVIEDRNGVHIGIWNCRRRLKYYYGDQYAMRITSQLGEGTQIWMELPKEPCDKEKTARALHDMGRMQ